MTEAAGGPGGERSIAVRQRQPLALALGLISFSVLLYEILLTRIFSVVLLYHFAYVAISLALLGFSMGALWVHYRPALHAADRIGRTAVVYSAAYALSILGCVLFLIHFRPAGVDLYEGLNLPTFRYLLLTYAAATVPFVLSGICVSALLTAGRDAIGHFYGFDLLGAALGAVAVIPVVDALGAPNGMLVAAAAAGASGLLLAARGRRLPKLLPVAVLGILVATWALSLESSVLSLRYAKGSLETELLFERWNSFSRVTAEPKGNGVILRIDSGAATRIYPASQHARLTADIHTPAMHLRRGGDILIIGPGGGMEVAAAATLGLGTITGVELNPIVAELATVRYRKLAGGLYDRDEVRIVTAEGRSFLRHADRRYDVIMLTLVDTWAATAAGAFALSENNLYTVEGFSDYLSRLRDDGILSITRWHFPERPREALRLVALGRAALEAEGVRAPGRHLVVIEREAQRHPATFLMKKSPFSEPELDALESMVRIHSGWRFLLAPRGEHDPTFTTLATTSDPQTFYREYARDVSPPTDDRPFFFYVIRPGELWNSFESDFHRLPDVTNVGVFLLVSSLVADGVAVILLIGIPLVVQRRGPLAPGRAVAPALAYFACLGVGFMMVEVVLMQKFILFLGHPTRALTAVLFVLLCAGGAGSLYCGRLDAVALRARIPLWLSLIAALGLAYAWGLGILFESAIGLPVEARVGLSVVCLAPLGFLLGTCFPAGVRLLGDRAELLIPWIWAINGATSVLGSALAMLTAMNRGFGVALLAGFAMYALALVCVLRFRAPTAARV
jgi:predicted membrane-bound spermidine synthase